MEPVRQRRAARQGDLDSWGNTAINFRVAAGRYRLVGARRGDLDLGAGHRRVPVDGEPDPVGDPAATPSATTSARSRPAPLRRPFGGAQTPHRRPHELRFVYEPAPRRSSSSRTRPRSPPSWRSISRTPGTASRQPRPGAQRLNALAAESPALIILDLNLPDMDGIEICRRRAQELRRADPDADRS